MATTEELLARIAGLRSSWGDGADTDTDTDLAPDDAATETDDERRRRERLERFQAEVKAGTKKVDPGFKVSPGGHPYTEAAPVSNQPQGVVGETIEGSLGSVVETAGGALGALKALLGGEATIDPEADPMLAAARGEPQAPREGPSGPSRVFLGEEQAGRPSAVTAGMSPLMAIPSAVGGLVSEANDETYFDPMLLPRALGKGGEQLLSGPLAAMLTLGGHADTAAELQAGMTDPVKESMALLTDQPGLQTLGELGLYSADMAPWLARGVAGRLAARKAGKAATREAEDVLAREAEAKVAREADDVAMREVATSATTAKAAKASDLIDAMEAELGRGDVPVGREELLRILGEGIDEGRAAGRASPARTALEDRWLGPEPARETLAPSEVKARIKEAGAQPIALPGEGAAPETRLLRGPEAGRKLTDADLARRRALAMGFDPDAAPRLPPDVAPPTARPQPGLDYRTGEGGGKGKLKLGERAPEAELRERMEREVGAEPYDAAAEARAAPTSKLIDDVAADAGVRPAAAPAPEAPAPVAPERVAAPLAKKRPTAAFKVENRLGGKSPHDPTWAADADTLGINPKGEMGAASPAALGQVAGAAAGGAVGYASADENATPGEKFLRAIGGAAVGGILPAVAGLKGEAGVLNIGRRAKSEARATELFDRLRVHLPEAAVEDLAAVLQKTNGYSAEEATAVATHAFTRAGRSPQGAPLAAVARAQGATPREAERLVATANKFPDRNPLETPAMQEARRASGGRPTSDPASPGSAPPGHAEATGDGAGLLAAELEAKSPATYHLSKYSPLHGQGPIISNLGPAGQTVRGGMTGFEQDKRIVMEAALHHGATPQAGAVHAALKDLPAPPAIIDAIPEPLRKRLGPNWQAKAFSFFDQNARKGARWSDLVPNAAERAALEKDPGLLRARDLNRKWHRALGRATGLPEPVMDKMGDYMSHVTSRETGKAEIAKQMEALKALPASAEREAAIKKLHEWDKLYEGLDDAVWTEGQTRLGKDPFMAAHLKREGGADLYANDDLRAYYNMYGTMAARKIALERPVTLTYTEALAHDARVANLIKKAEGKLYDAKGAAEKSEALKALADLKARRAAPVRRWDHMRDAYNELVDPSFRTTLSGRPGGKRYKIGDSDRELVSDYMANGIGLKRGKAHGEAWLESVTSDMLSSPDPETARWVKGWLKGASAEMMVSKNPGYALNVGQHLFAGPALMPGFTAQAEGIMAKHAASVATRGGGHPIVRELLDELGLKDLDVIHADTGGLNLGKVGRKAVDAIKAVSLRRTELVNHVGIGTMRTLQVRALNDALAPVERAMRARGVAVTAESLAAEAAKSRAIMGTRVAGREVRAMVPGGKSLFYQDRYYAQADQLLDMAHARLSGTVKQFTLRQAREAIDTSIFHYGKSERPWVIAKAVNSGIPGVNALDVPFMFTSYAGKQVNLMWSRMTPAGKLKLLYYPFVIGGPKAVPFVGMLASQVPAVDQWFHDAEDGLHGPVATLIMRANIYHGLLNRSIPNMGLPLGNDIPGLNLVNSDYLTAQTGFGRFVQSTASLAGGVGRVAGNLTVPPAESAMHAQVPNPAGAALDEMGRQTVGSVPLFKRIKQAASPDETSVPGRFAAFFAMTPEEQEREWGTVRQLMGARERGSKTTDQVKREYTFRALANVDIDFAHFAEDINLQTAVSGLQTKPADFQKSMRERNLPYAVRAMRGLSVTDETFPKAISAWEQNFSRLAEGNDNKAAVFIQLTSTDFLEALHRSHEKAAAGAAAARALGPKGADILAAETRRMTDYKTAAIEVTTKLKEGGISIEPPDYQRLSAKSYNPKDDPAKKWLENFLARPAATKLSSAELRVAAEAEAQRRVPPEYRDAAFALIAATQKTIGLATYRDNLYVRK